MGLEDLRREALEEDITVEGYENYVSSQNIAAEKIFGMTAAERMFVSIGCFILTSLGGFLLLLVMEKIAL
jgi:hypothetical protein